MVIHVLLRLMEEIAFQLMLNVFQATFNNGYFILSTNIRLTKMRSLLEKKMGSKTNFLSQFEKYAYVFSKKIMVFDLNFFQK